MNKNKDYYLVLGVYPEASIDIIITSYHWLLSYYKSKNSDENSIKNNHQIFELNTAYLILSNTNKRTVYERLRGNKNHLAWNYFSTEHKIEPASISLLNNDWLIATSQYPELIEIEKNLNALSWSLSRAFKFYLLEKKQFFLAKQVAHRLENQFLDNFFSKNRIFKALGKDLILSRETTVSHQLNQLIYCSEEKLTTDNVIQIILNKYSINGTPLNHLLIQVALKLKPELVKRCLQAGANVNSLVDGNQSLFSFFNNKYGFMRYRGNEVEIGKRYEIERIFYKYGAKKIDIEQETKKKMHEEKLKRRRTIENIIIISLFLTWLIYLY